jgi:hypothetical protein
MCGFELISFDIHFTSKRVISFICVYLPPDGAKVLKTVKALLKILKRFVSKQEVYVLGDFNFSNYEGPNTITTISTNTANANDVTTISPHQPLNEFILFLEKHNLHQLITSPTHIDGNILDLVITSKPQNVMAVEVLSPFTSTCDHNMIEMQIHNAVKNDPTFTPKRNFYSANYTLINSYLSTIDWDNALASTADINAMYTKFLEIIHQAIQLYVPMSKKRKKTFLPKEIRSILKEKRILYQKLKSDKSLKTAYKEQEKLYRKAVAKYRNLREQRVLANNSKKALFNYVNQKLHTRHSIPPLKNANGEICLDPKEKADLLNRTFSQIFLNENNPIQLPPLLKNNTHVIPNDCPTISKEDILLAIFQLKSSVSQTPDSIPSLFVKRTSTQLLRPLSIIFGFSIYSGQVPALWKKAIVVPIHKKDKINDPSNYRPISLTSVICRIFEKILHKNMMLHLLNNRIISDAQHGFVYGRSTQTQQLHFLDKLTSMFDKKTQVDIIYLDFSKAFDKVSHTKLLHVLHHYKFHNHLITWIKNYLTGRTQTTSVDSCYSDYISVSSGVPQGSVLGPLLFIIYLDDLIRTIQTLCHATTVYAYADDIKLSSTDPIDLQHALDIVSTWTNTWKLQLNKDKSEHLSIRHQQQHTFNICNQMIPKTNTVRDLGITISDDLKWSPYIEKIRSKANILSHIILRTFSPINTHLLVNLYKIYVRPIMEYNTCTWSPYLISDKDRAENVQQMFTRRLCQKANIKYTDYNDRLSKLNLESLAARRTKSDLILVYKIINNLVDVDCTKFFNFNSFGGHNLRRHSLQLTLNKPAANLCRQNFFSYRVAKIWNSLPSNIVASPSLEIFKHRLKLLSLDT